MTENVPQEMKRVGARLRGLRREKGLTLLEVGEATGMSLSLISDVERGAVRSSLARLGRLAAFYGVSIGELFTEHEVRRDEKMPTGGREDVEPFIGAVLSEVGESQRTKGLVRYGQPLRTWDGRDVWLDDVLPEYHDLGRYIGKAMMQYRDVLAENARLRELLKRASKMVEECPSYCGLSDAEELLSDIYLALKEG